MSLKTTPWDASEHILDDHDAGLYLAAVMDEAIDAGDPSLIPLALRDIANARGMSDLARASGVSRRALYDALSEHGDPKLSTLLAVMKALGVRMAPAEAA
jgi:probable addiction module antidote protein